MENKIYEIILEGSCDHIRSLDELNKLLDYMVENENYELCQEIKNVIDNYDELIQNI